MQRGVERGRGKARVEVADVGVGGEHDRAGALDARRGQVVRIGRIAIEDAHRKAFRGDAVKWLRVAGDHDHPLAEPHQLLERADAQRLEPAQHDVAAELCAGARGDGPDRHSAHGRTATRLM